LPYGIKYGSNFQPLVNKRDVKDKKDENLTSEPKRIKAFRDTWELVYMGYFDKEEKAEDDNPPIGIILSKEKDELLVEYATYGMSSQLFVSKYQLYLPNKEELRKLLNNQLEGLKRLGGNKKPAKPSQKKTKW
jgi:hypothetical protein